jgi:type 1 fimbria pilin
MALLPRNKPNTLSTGVWIGSIIMIVAFAAVLVSCGGSGSSMSNGGTGTVHVSITDPPSCKFPNGDFQHIYVTIRSVQAHTSATADDNTPGWQELAPQLNTQPMQIDLLAEGQTAC